MYLKIPDKIKFNNNLNFTLKHAKNYLTGSVISALLSLVSVPILTYNLTTENYGLYSIFTSWIQILLVLFTLDLTASLDRYFFEERIEFSFSVFSPHP